MKLEGGAKMELKKLRESKKITQKQASEICGISLRSYKTYENDIDKKTTIKYAYLVDTLSKYNVIDEEHGVLNLEDIISICNEVFSKYDISYCYLFGSYAKGKALGNSDVDLLIGSSLSGIKYYGLVEELRQRLQKKIDALSFEQLRNNMELTNEILKEGIKIYG